MEFHDAVAGGLMGIHHSLTTDIIGLAVFVVLIVVQVIEKRRDKVEKPSGAGDQI